MKPPRYWKKLERHDLSGEYPDITGETWQQFVATVKEKGVVGRRKVTLHEGKVLDGWQLQRACVEANVKPDYQALPRGVTPEEFVEIANDTRRHETDDVIRARTKARRERVAKARAEGQSIRAIAEAEDVSLGQVQRDLKATSGVSPDTPEVANSPENSNVEIPRAANGTVTGRDGKTYSASAPTVFCARCKRIGVPVQGCEACKEARKKKPPREPGDDTDSENEAKKKQRDNKNGRVTFDWPKFHREVGPVVRAAEAIAKAYQDRGKEFHAAEKAMEAYLVAMKNWQERLTGKKARTG